MIRKKKPKISLTVSAADGKSQRVVRAVLGDVLHQDTFNTDSDRSRQRFINRLAEMLKREPAKLEYLHKTLVAEAGKADEAVETAAIKHMSMPTSLESPEIDPGRIIRPERFIVPEANGLTVPALFKSEDGSVVKWVQYIRHKDGHRERRFLSDTLDLGSAPLHVFPQPAAPGVGQFINHWSLAGRKGWIKKTVNVSPVKVFAGLVDRFDHYLDLPSDDSDGHLFTLALWTILTYCYHAWPAVPYLYVGGPTGSGKTQVFEVLSRLAFRPLRSSSLTAPALFRTIHDRGGTLLFDEAERLRRLQDPAMAELHSMLLAGYKRGGQATRLDGDSFRPIEFDVYGPKALACIAGLPAALSSRCISVPMVRADPDNPKLRRRIDEAPAQWQYWRDSLHRLTLDYGAMWPILVKQRDVCPEMSGRNFELWQPLLALADWIDGLGRAGLRDAMTKHAMRSISSAMEDAVPECDERLLRCLARKIAAGHEPRASEILRSLKSDAGGDYFAEWSDRGVSSKLSSYGLHTCKTNGKKLYRRDLLPVLMRVAKNYSIDLQLEGKKPVPENKKTGYVGHVGARSHGDRARGHADTNGRVDRAAQ